MFLSGFTAFVSALFPIGIYGQSTKGNLKRWEEELSISIVDAIGSHSLIDAQMVYII
jgi:hypothetical protein